MSKHPLERLTDTELEELYRRHLSGMLGHKEALLPIMAERARREIERECRIDIETGRPA